MFRRFLFGLLGFSLFFVSCAAQVEVPLADVVAVEIAMSQPSATPTTAPTATVVPTNTPVPTLDMSLVTRAADVAATVDAHATTSAQPPLNAELISKCTFSGFEIVLFPTEEIVGISVGGGNAEVSFIVSGPYDQILVYGASSASICTYDVTNNRNKILVTLEDAVYELYQYTSHNSEGKVLTLNFVQR